jgi:hypothetical protein
VIDATDERARDGGGAAFTDAVTFAFGDPAAEVYGLARLGLSPAPDGGGGRVASALAVLFSGREPVSALARGGLPVPDGAGWEALAVPGLAATVEAPLHAWTVGYAGGEHGFELTFEALGPPAELDPGHPVAAAGGMAGYEQVCRVRGTVRTGGRVHEVACLGQRGHAWGEPDWDRIAATRTIGAWLPDGSGLALTGVRGAEAADHGAEPVWAAVFEEAGALPIDAPRLSTTYDGDGRQRRAGLELWIGDEDGYPLRGSGEVICGSTLDLGQLRLDCAFFRWRIEGDEGVGRYDVVRRAT